MQQQVVGVVGNVGGVTIISSADLKPPWPVCAYGPDFEAYLDELSVWISKTPNSNSSLNSLNYDDIENDIYLHNTISNNNSNLSAANILKIIINMKQDQLLNVLTPESIKGFEAYPKFKNLEQIAEKGLADHLVPEFQCNKGMVDQSRPSYRTYERQILHDVNKMQRAGKCLIFPRSMLVGTEGLHVSPIHVVVKAGDDKIRITVDASASGLNGGTDMLEVKELLGLFTNPNLKSVAEMLAAVVRDGEAYLRQSSLWRKLHG